MAETPYVSTKWTMYARDIEKKIASLPMEAGVAFVSVTADPVVGGEVSKMQIYLGITRELSVETGMHLVENVIKNLDTRITFSCTVVRGVSGNAVVLADFGFKNSVS